MPAEVAHTPSSGQLFVQGLPLAQDDTVTLQRFTTWGAIGFQLSGTWAGTFTFECTVDGTNWVGLFVTPSVSGTQVLTATANGIWYIPGNNYQAVRLRWSTKTSGAPTATILSRPSQ